MARTKAKFKQPKKSESYSVASKSMSVEEKLKVLRKFGQEDLIDIFKGWEPRQTKRKRKSAPLDHRLVLTVTDRERMDLIHDLDETNKIGEKTSISAFVRNRAMGSVDINGWKNIATAALEELNEISLNEKELNAESMRIKGALELEEDPEEVGLLEKRLSEINLSLQKIVAQNEKRSNRLSGRVSMVEAETIKWRAARLCISTSDYLRFLIFSHDPDGRADAHMSLDAKRRFYVSIIDVANNGWGQPPTIAHCTQCTNYLEEIDKLRDRVKQLETFI